MKTISFRRRSNALLSPGGASIGVLLIIFALLIALFRIFFPGAFIVVVSPVLEGGAAISSFFTQIRASFADQIQLAEERDQLKSDNGSLQSENLALVARIEDITALLGSAPSETKGIVAGVLSRPPESPYDTLVVAVGSTSGVSAGMRVYASGAVAIGIVDSVTASSARITLYSSPGTVLAAWVGEDRIPTTLTGGGGGTFLSTVPKAAGIEIGDIVYLASGGASPIGRVRLVESDPSSTDASLFISPTINLFSLTWVKLVP